MFFFFGQSLRAVDLFSSALDLMYFARINEVPSAPRIPKHHIVIFYVKK
jgi:hypothetical protein